MNDEYLSHEELTFVTGTKQNARQIKWLRDRHWRFDISGTGRPIVLKLYRDQRLGPTRPYVRKKKEPRFDLIQ